EVAIAEVDARVRHSSFTRLPQPQSAAGLVDGARSTHQAGSKVVASRQMTFLAGDLVVFDRLVELASLGGVNGQVVARLLMPQAAGTSQQGVALLGPLLLDGRRERVAR